MSLTTSATEIPTNAPRHDTDTGLIAMYEWSRKKLKRMVVAVMGITVLVIGIAMIILPGPAIVVIPAALAILATEFAWARRLLHRVRERMERAANNRKNDQQPKP
ncbi:PGPGW domain-containing protein [Geobacter sp. FeAm09]|uniref:PGPGW domain-containing protein n=1 Tax=Geobacter sp. FeAm09 TaxID=2597769 RepID=UPI001F0F61C1|nr:PGPGW domain-containing protein [Geobacter sp. FeAm09]